MRLVWRLFAKTQKNIFFLLVGLFCSYTLAMLSNCHISRLRTFKSIKYSSFVAAFYVCCMQRCEIVYEVKILVIHLPINSSFDKSFFGQMSLNQIRLL